MRRGVEQNGEGRDAGGDHGSMPCDQGMRAQAGGQPCLWRDPPAHCFTLPAGPSKQTPNARNRIVLYKMERQTCSRVHTHPGGVLRSGMQVVARVHHRVRHLHRRAETV